jgi:Fibronectin type III domain
VVTSTAGARVSYLVSCTCFGVLAMFRSDPYRCPLRKQRPGSRARRSYSRLVGRLLALALLVGLASDLYGAAVTLRWDASPGQNTAGYKVYYKKGKPGPPYRGVGANEGPSPINVGNTTTFTLTGLDEAETYYVAVTCYDAQGRESPYSSEVVITSGFAKSGTQVKRTESPSDTSAVIAAVRLPSGMVVPLNQRQLNLIKEQTGVFFGATAADMLSPGEAVVPVPAELGGGYLYGSPEHLAQAFVAARATEGTTPATHLFVKPRSCLW